MAEPESSFLGARWATILIVVVLLGFAGVVGFSVIDRTKTESLESFSQTSAVGDTRYYEVPLVQLAIPEPILTWQGRLWAPANYQKVKIDDPSMIEVGHDEKTAFRIYRERSKSSDSPVYVKIDVGEYLRLEAR